MIITIDPTENPRGRYTTFHASNKVVKALAQLMEAKLGFATIHGYKPTTNWATVPVQDINFNFGFLTSRLYKAQREAVSTMTLADLDSKMLTKWIPSKGKDSFATAEEQFDHCKEKMIGTIGASLTGELDNAHTEAHTECYCTVRNSIKVHFVTETIELEDGRKVKRPVLGDDGLPTVASILIPYLERHTTTIVEGVRKEVKSGSKVLMDKAIEYSLPKSLKFRMVSLKEDNFDDLKMSGETITV